MVNKFIEYRDTKTAQRIKDDFKNVKDNSIEYSSIQEIESKLSQLRQTYKDEILESKSKNLKKQMSFLRRTQSESQLDLQQIDESQIKKMIQDLFPEGVISTKSIADMVGNTLIATFFRSLLIRAVKDEFLKGDNNNDKYLSDSVLNEFGVDTWKMRSMTTQEEKTQYLKKILTQNVQNLFAQWKDKVLAIISLQHNYTIQ